MMRHIYFIFCCLLTFVFAACATEEDLEVPSVNTAGKRITDIEIYTTDGSSRTSYGQLSNGKFAVHWADGDKVYVHSNEACGDDQGTKLTAPLEYTCSITSTASGSSIYKLGGASMYWGNDTIHHFYTFYPSSGAKSMKVNADSCTIATSIPATQKVTKVGSVDENGVTYDYYTNMDYALMAGHSSFDRTNPSSTLRLPFIPITTALDIYIEPWYDDSGSDQWTIKSLTVANNSQTVNGRASLAGDFTYTMKGAATPVVVQPNDSKVFNVQVEFPGDGLVATSGKGLKVTVFLLPTFNKEVRIAVNAVGEHNGKHIQMHKERKTGPESPLVAGAKNVIRTGKRLPTIQEEAKDSLNSLKTTNSSWMSGVADSLMIRCLSIPGTYNSGAYDTGLKPSAKAQLGGITAQLNNGARVLDFQSSYASNEYTIVGASNKSTGGSGFPSLSTVVDSMAIWLAQHTTESVIVILRNESASTNKAGWRSNINDYIKGLGYSDYVLNDFTPNIDMRGARGKIMFWLLDPDCTTDLGWLLQNWGTGNTATIKNVTGSVKVLDDYCFKGSSDDKQTKKTRIEALFTNGSLPVSASANTLYYTSLALTDGTTGNKTTDTTYDTQASILNPYMLGKISTMTSGQSLGIVLVTMCCGTEDDENVFQGSTLLKAIWDQNFK